MKKLLFLLLLSPFLANAQFVNQTVRRTISNGTLYTYSGGDTIPRVTGIVLNGRPLVYNSVLNKWTASLLTTSGADTSVTGFATSYALQGKQNALIINVKDYGAVGNGVTDDRTAIISAIAAAGDGGEVYFPNGTYLISTTITPAVSVSLKGSGNSVIISDETPFNITSTNLVLSTTIEAITAAEDDIVTGVSAASVQQGDIAIITDLTRDWDPSAASSMYGETNIVSSVSGSNVVLGIKSSTDYPSGTSISFYRPWENIRIQDLTFRRITKVSNTVIGLQLGLLKNAIVNNVVIDGFGYGGLFETRNVGLNVTNFKAVDIYYPALGFGYGIQSYESILTKISNSSFVNCRRGVDFSGLYPSRFSSVSNSESNAPYYGVGLTSGFGTHTTAEYCTFENLTATNINIGVQIRGNYISVKNFTANSVNTVISSESGKGRFIDGVYTAKLINSPNNYTGIFYDEASDQAGAGATGTGVGIDAVIIKNVSTTVDGAFVSVSGNVLGNTTFNVDNVNVYKRPAGTNYFFQVANQESAKTFTVYMTNARYENATGGLPNYSNSIGTNATLAITDPISIASANGVSGTVAYNNYNPVITLALGAIMPTSVAASGTVTGSNLSGTNTGDQTSVTGNAGTATALQNARTIGTLTGDVTSAGSSFNGTANNTNATTLATVNSNVGAFGSSTSIPSITVNGKGLITAVSGNAVIAPAGTLTGTTLNSGVTTSSLTSVGTLTSLNTGAITTTGLLSVTKTGEQTRFTTTGDVSGAGTNFMNFYDAIGLRMQMGFAGASGRWDINNTVSGGTIRFENTGGTATVTNTGGLTLSSGLIATTGAFSGNVTAPTQSAGDNSTRVATTAYVDGAVGVGTTYTPTVTGLDNVTSSTPGVHRYTKVGNMVTVRGYVNIEPASTGFTRISINLPVSSTFSGSYPAGDGVFTYSGSPTGTALVSQESNAAEIYCTIASASSMAVRYTFMYSVN